MKKIKFKSTITTKGQQCDEIVIVCDASIKPNYIHFISKDETRELVNIIEYSKTKVTLTRGTAHLDLVLDKETDNNYLTTEGEIKLKTTLKKVDFTDTNVRIEYEAYSDTKDAQIFVVEVEWLK